MNLLCLLSEDVKKYTMLSLSKACHSNPGGNAANTDLIIRPWYAKGKSVLWCWTPFSASNTAGKDNSDFGKALWRWALYSASNTAEKYCQESGK